MSQQKPQSEQLEFFEIPSPCIGVCESGPRGFCKGCLRSRDERLYWFQVNDATKRHIIAACIRRKRAIIARERKKYIETQSKKTTSQIDLFENRQSDDK
ncbi:DUF1289 domain-containing protein [Alteromonas sp. A081]|uniref:DUF1289 domain-containing protein n=1 Tax=Alteromonas sp. A081 TaxID=3410269 RepID=UPI003B980BA6